mgnify:CR=1 FL=1
MPRPLVTELPPRAPAEHLFPEPPEAALEWAKQVPAELRRTSAPPLPALDEAALREHFSALAAVSQPPWPGAAAAARAAALPGLSALHPWQPPPTYQGALEVLHEVARALAALTGLDRFSLQPACLEDAERAAVRLARASAARTQPQRNRVLAPPGSPALSHARDLGLVPQALGRLPSGDLDIEALAAAVGPPTLLVVANWLTPAGAFDRALAAAGHVAHAHGALFGVDATGLARLAGHTRLREADADIVWLSLAELAPAATSAALGVRAPLTDCLPTPLVGKERRGYGLDSELHNTIGPLSFGPARLADALLAYVALRTLGTEGLRSRAEALARSRQ